MYQNLIERVKNLPPDSYPSELLEAAVQLSMATQGFTQVDGEAQAVYNDLLQTIDDLEAVSEPARSIPSQADQPESTVPERATVADQKASKPRKPRKPREPRSPKPTSKPASKPSSRASKSSPARSIAAPLSAAEKALKAFIRLSGTPLTADNILTRLRALQRMLYTGLITKADPNYEQIMQLLSRYQALHKAAQSSKRYCVTVGQAQLSGWGMDVGSSPELYGIRVKLDADKARRLTEARTEVLLWSERDRVQLELRHRATQKTLALWVDEELRELIDDGFIRVGRWEDGDPAAHASALAYVRYLTGADARYADLSGPDQEVGDRIVAQFRGLQGKTKSVTELARIVKRIHRAFDSGALSAQDRSFPRVQRIEQIYVKAYNQAMRNKCAAVIPIDIQVFLPEQELKASRAKKAKRTSSRSPKRRAA